MLNDTVPVDPAAPSAVGDYDNDTIADLMVKFNRTELISYILLQFTECNGTLALNLTGKLNDGTICFEGIDIITVSTLVGDINCDGVVNILDLVKACTSYNSRDEEPNWNANANFAPPYEKIDIFDLVTAVAHYGETC